MDYGYRWAVPWVLMGCVSMFAAKSGDATAAKTLDRVTDIMRQYDQDITELPLDVTTTIQKFDLQDRIVSTKRNTHRFEVTESRSGSNTRGTAVLREVQRGSMGEHELADLTPMMVGLLFRRGVVSATKFEVTSNEHVVVVSHHTAGTCHSFDVDEHGFKLTSWCGKERLTVDAATWTPLEYSFEAGGLPLTIDKRELRSYRVKQTFQTVRIETGKRPFLLPKTVVATIETHKGKTVITSSYQLHKQ